MLKCKCLLPMKQNQKDNIFAGEVDSQDINLLEKFFENKG